MRKILVVEDDRFIAAIFTMFLRDMGHEMVGRCQTGREALDLCRSLNPDVVLMDIHLDGDWDGIQTADRITRELHIPVIFVSSDTDDDVIGRAIVSNSYGYLVKPINKKELGISIDLAYYKHRVDQELKQREKGYRQFISESPLPMVIVSNGKIQYLNNNALSLFRSHYIEDMLGLPFIKFMGDVIPNALQSILEQACNGIAKFPVFRLPIKDLHNNLFYAELMISSVEFNRKTSLQIILRNLSAELNMELRVNALSYVVNSGINCFFVVGSDLLLLDYSRNIPDIKVLLDEGSCNVRFDSRTLTVLGSDGVDQFKAVFSDGNMADGAPMNICIGNGAFKTFYVRRIASSVDDYSGILFYSWS